MSNQYHLEEFNRQVATLLEKEYHDMAGLSEEEFIIHVEPLKQLIEKHTFTYNEPEEGYFPFVIVIKSELVTADQTIQRVVRKKKQGFSVMEADDIEKFKPIENLVLPEGMAYLLLDIDTGKETRNITPNAALQSIMEANKSPLTIDEGIAVITHFPDTMQKNNCFYLLGSRCGDKRVTALWLSTGKPKLGWCWAGNPHTWLGSASCGSRVGGLPE
ncbi:DUF5701 family protein [Brevibacillus daliensis]|uniref:DUF5701 family protein n=1 Tax=Brevibacillus daliensis TaxID=2892995 RepID=UPI001E33B04F|nr:DUF5701 family protein [Brevibacillus daliensis]